MTSSRWFGLLTVLSILIFSGAVWRNNWRRVLTIYLTMAGLTYSAELVVLVLLHSYAYHPRVLPEPYFDNVLGAVVSDAFVIPMLSTVAATRQWNWLGIALAAVAIGRIEDLSVGLYAYERFWWKTLYTQVGLVVWLLVAKWLDRRLHAPLSSRLRAAILYVATFFIASSLIFVTQSVVQFYRFQPGWFSDWARDTTIFSAIYSGLISTLFTAVVVRRSSWLWKAAVPLALMPADWFLTSQHLLVLSPAWSLWYTAAQRLLVIAIVTLFHDRVLMARDDAVTN